MLIDVVQAVEGIEISPLPTRIWFDRADRINSILPHALYFSVKSRFEIFGTLRNQKACLVPVAFRIPGSDQIQFEQGGLRRL